jgi:hypothetical protein
MESFRPSCCPPTKYNSLRLLPSSWFRGEVGSIKVPGVSYNGGASLLFFEELGGSSEAGLFQLTEFLILDVTLGNTHLSAKSWRVIVRPLATNFLFSIQEQNST